MYRTIITQIAPSYDPRHIEAHMRSELGTLDHLSSERFAAEVTAAVMCIEAGGAEMAEKLAQSYGM
jgi:hypothetical protein